MSLFSRIRKIVLDTLFPISCFSCEVPDQWICGKCLAGIRIRENQFCPACENIATPYGKICPSCRERRKTRLDGLVVAASYENPLLKRLVSGFKYRFITDLAEPLGHLLTGAIVQNDLPVPDFIVPVPLHPRRLRWRGFNQSRLLAEKIAGEITPLMRIEVLEILGRKKYRKPQMGIKKYQDRLDNVKGIFHLENGFLDLKNKQILLIDDIATTGATLEECARVLKSAGAKKVFAAVIARQNY